MCAISTRVLLLPHDVIACFTLQTLHIVVSDAKRHVVETSPILAHLGYFLVSVNQLLDSKGPLMEIFSHFLLPEIIFERVHTQHLTA